ncbi:MAG: hypothetical protein R3E09_11360 [Novosphingobium sp.]
MFSMIIAGRLMGKVDTRLLLLFGMISTGTGFLMMSGLSLESHQMRSSPRIMLAIGSGMICSRYRRSSSRRSIRPCATKVRRCSRWFG